MKKDVHNRADIIILVDAFYKNVTLNPQIGPIFTKVAQVDWAHHLPKMYDFWESILFGKAIYKGNPMLTHFALNKQTPLQNNLRYGKISFSETSTICLQAPMQHSLNKKLSLLPI